MASFSKENGLFIQLKLYLYLDYRTGIISKLLFNITGSVISGAVFSVELLRLQKIISENGYEKIVFYFKGGNNVMLACMRAFPGMIVVGQEDSLM